MQLESVFLADAGSAVREEIVFEAENGLNVSAPHTVATGAKG